MTAALSLPAIEIVGASQDTWEVSKPYRVRVGKYSWCYCPDEANAIEFARKCGQTEVELSPRMALDPTERHEADEPSATEARVPFGQEVSAHEQSQRWGAGYFGEE